MLKEYAPNLARVAVLFNSESGSYQSYYKETAEAAARALAIELEPNPINSELPGGVRISRQLVLPPFLC